MAYHKAFDVRRATTEDAQDILDCLSSAFAPYRQSYTEEAFGDTVLTPASLARRFAGMTIYVACGAAGEIVGTISLGLISDDEGHIRGMAVMPAWQGRGVAESLLAAVECELQERKCSRVRLDTTQPLKRAVRFYENRGFRPSGVVSDFFGMPLFEYVKLL